MKNFHLQFAGVAIAVALACLTMLPAQSSLKSLGGNVCTTCSNCCSGTTAPPVACDTNIGCNTAITQCKNGTTLSCTVLFASDDPKNPCKLGNCTVLAECECPH